MQTCGVDGEKPVTGSLVLRLASETNEVARFPRAQHAGWLALVTAVQSMIENPLFVTVRDHGITSVKPWLTVPELNWMLRGKGDRSCDPT